LFESEGTCGESPHGSVDVSAPDAMRIIGPDDEARRVHNYPGISSKQLDITNRIQVAHRALVLNINKRGLVESSAWEIILHQDLVTQTIGDPMDMGNCSQAPGKLILWSFDNVDPFSLHSCGWLGNPAPPNG